jgi:hypothetical protein
MRAQPNSMAARHISARAVRRWPLPKPHFFETLAVKGDATMLLNLASIKDSYANCEREHKELHG